LSYPTPPPLRPPDWEGHTPLVFPSAHTPPPTLCEAHTHSLNPLYAKRTPTRYENFLEQLTLAKQLTSSDFGISTTSTGLINQNYWENSKWRFVNLERGNAADKLNGRNINVSFTNNSNVPIEVMVFILYSDEIAIDVKTGLVTRHKN
jgi:hypothetical protein